MRCNRPDAAHLEIVAALIPHRSSCHRAMTPHCRSARRDTRVTAIRIHPLDADCVDPATWPMVPCPRCPLNTASCRGCDEGVAEACRAARAVGVVGFGWERGADGATW